MRKGWGITHGRETNMAKLGCSELPRREVMETPELVVYEKTGDSGLHRYGVCGMSGEKT